MSDDDVQFVIILKEKVWAAIDVEFVNKHDFRPPANPIYESNDTSRRSKTNDTEDESGDDDGGQAKIEDGTEERGVVGSVIYINGTHLKARTRSVLLVAVCNEENKMIYPFAFGFADYECTESWTWFLKKLHKLIQYPDRVMLVLNRHNGIINAKEAVFLDASHKICAYHLIQNLKRFCKQRDDVIWLYYHAIVAYRIEEFDLAMAKLKETYRKVYDELLGTG
ncbi:hypothetical protein Ddye_021377 [Dipteronia dyeriana]|uniref:MULE transposase domain-containing protein n=1 Tax=Dipteronia dyeriana TaxID=168575 RepID=A0AAD9U255_9ROSI|nr:hypothetical protein Ddye_021377 [Dipteronia dyeriana]